MEKKGKPLMACLWRCESVPEQVRKHFVPNIASRGDESERKNVCHEAEAQCPARKWECVPQNVEKWLQKRLFHSNDGTDALSAGFVLQTATTSAKTVRVT